MVDETVAAHLETLKGRNQAILYGLEAHVCIRQTALDLLERNYEVHLVVDACSSMNHYDRNVAIESLRDSGVSLITFQSLVFELMKDSQHPNFKAMLNVVKQNPKEPIDLHSYKL